MLLALHRRFPDGLTVDNPDGDLDWLDSSTGRLVVVPYLLGAPFQASQAALYSIAGPLVYFQDEQGTGDRVLDTRTGAVLRVPLLGQLFGSHGRFVGDPGALVSGRSGLLRLDTADLPAARC